MWGKSFLGNRNMGRFLIFCSDFGSRILLQAIYFIFISRALGAAGLGVFASLTAMTTLAACFSGLGTEQILIVKSSLDGFEIRQHFGRALLTTALTFVPLFLLALLATHFLLQGTVGIQYAILVIVSDLLFTRLVSVGAACLYVKHKIFLQTVVNNAPFICKVALAAGAYLFAGDISIDTWCLLYAIGSIFGGVLAYLITVLQIGNPVFERKLGHLGDGLLFSLEYASLAAFRDLDKPVVNVALGSAATGAYAAAFRVVDTSCVPVRAFLQSTYIQYFAVARRGHRAAVTYSIRNGWRIALIGAALGVMLLVVAPYVPKILGASYANSIEVIWYLALYPVLLGVTAVGSDVLRALGLQKARLVAIGLTYLAYLPSIYIGATSFGLIGAATARIFTQALALVLTWAIVFVAARRSGPAIDVPVNAA